MLNSTNLMQWWKAILKSGDLPPEYSKWTEEEKAKLKEMVKLVVDIGDTALVHAQSLNKYKLLNYVDKMSMEGRAELRYRLVRNSTSSSLKS